MQLSFFPEKLFYFAPKIKKWEQEYDVLAFQTVHKLWLTRQNKNYSKKILCVYMQRESDRIEPKLQEFYNLVLLTFMSESPVCYINIRFIIMLDAPLLVFGHQLKVNKCATISSKKLQKHYEHVWKSFLD